MGHVFAEQKARMKFIVRTVGIACARTKFGLANLAYTNISQIGGSPPIDGRIGKLPPNSKVDCRCDRLRRSKFASSAALVVASHPFPAHFGAVRAHVACRSPCADHVDCQHGTGSLGRRSSIMSRIRRNRSRGTATSAIWKVA